MRAGLPLPRVTHSCCDVRCVIGMGFLCEIAAAIVTVRAERAQGRVRRIIQTIRLPFAARQALSGVEIILPHRVAALSWFVRRRDVRTRPHDREIRVPIFAIAVRIITPCFGRNNIALITAHAPGRVVRNHAIRSQDAGGKVGEQVVVGVGESVLAGHVADRATIGVLHATQIVVGIVRVRRRERQTVFNGYLALQILARVKGVRRRVAQNPVLRVRGLRGQIRRVVGHGTDDTERVGGAGAIAGRVITIRRDIVRWIGCRDEPIRFVVRARRHAIWFAGTCFGFARLIAVRIVREGVVAIARGLVQFVRRACAVAHRVVAEGLQFAGRIRDRDDAVEFVVIVTRRVGHARGDAAKHIYGFTFSNELTNSNASSRGRTE